MTQLMRAYSSPKIDLLPFSLFNPTAFACNMDDHKIVKTVHFQATFSLTSLGLLDRELGKQWRQHGVKLLNRVK